MRNPLRFWLGTLTVFLLALIPSVVPVGGSVAPAFATTVGSGACQQTVDSATGVTATSVTVSGVSHCLVTFTATGSRTWTVPAGVTQVEYLIVAGGGAGGRYRGGGGGGGGVLEGTRTVASGNQTITVGAGGVGSSLYRGSAPTNGGNSSAFGLAAVGGGRGGNPEGHLPETGGSGGGGGAYDSGAQTGALGTAGQGFAGGSGSFAAGTPNGRSGGGGGAAGVGLAGTSSGAGNGGPGVLSTITGSYYGGGGGGGLDNRGVAKARGEGGVGGGGAGGTGQVGSEDDLPAVDGQANTGGGGGGNGQGTNFFYGETALSGDGGSGIVVVRYSLNPGPPTGTSVSSGDGQLTLGYTLPAHTGGGTLSLEYTTDGGSNWRDLGETDGTTTVSLESDGTALINGTLYTVKLRAKNTVGGSSFTSSEVTVGTVIPSPVGEVMRFDATHPDSFTVGNASWADLRGGLSGAPAGNASYDSRSKAFALDGTGDYLSFGSFGIDFSRGLAIHTVVDFGETVNYERVLEFTSGNGQAGNIAFGRFSTTSQLYFEVTSNTGTAHTCVSAAGAITAGFQAYSVIIGSDGTCTFRKNGANLVATDSSAQLPAVTVRDANYIGAARGAVNPLKGSIQSVVVYNTAQVTPTCAPIESTFTGDGTNGGLGVPYKALQFTTAGECDWTAPAGLVEADYLLVAGGGGGGGHIAGGGGAGEMVLGTKSDVSPGSSYRMTVGLGGVGGNRSYNNVVYNGAPGGDTSAFSLSGSGAITVNGGGGGATLGGTAGGAGGSGGGGSHSNVPGGASSLLASGFGHAGGGGSTLGCAGAVAGGGGGAGGAGEAAETDGSQHAGDGGAGRASTLTGVSVFYAGGGGGGINTGATCVSAGNPGEGGQGGGGAGGPKTVSTANADSRGFDGVANLGAGGGGASGNGLDQTTIRSGGNGGSGIVVLRYVDGALPAAVQAFSASDRFVDAGSDADSVSLSWTALTGQTPAVTQYEIEYSTSADFSSSSTQTVAVTNAAAATPNSTTISDLVDGARYYFRIKARNALGTSASATTISSRAISNNDYALDFDGTPPSAASAAQVVPATGTVTIEAWIKPDSANTEWRTVFFQGSSNSNRLGLWVQDSGTLHVARNTVTRGFLVGDLRGQWSHVALTADRSTNQITLYLNGSLVHSGSLGTGDHNGTGTFYVGRQFDELPLYFTGQIDQVKVWTSVLTQAQVQDSMHSWDAAGVTGSPSLLAHYDFNDNTQATAVRDMAGARDLTVQNGAVADFRALVERNTSARAGHDTYQFTRSYLTATGGWTVPTGFVEADVLVVGGGGGGGGTGARSNWSGGGGAGGAVVEETDESVSAGTVVPVLVGMGGFGGSGTVTERVPTAGGSSTFGALGAAGGGRGGHAIQDPTISGLNYPAGDSSNPTAGGGGGAQAARQLGASGSSHNGGVGFGSGTAALQAAGGGAGAGGAGVNASSSTAGAGGVGLLSTITSARYGGGGGGGKNTTPGSAGTGGSGGGGAGGLGTAGVSAGANTGGGGGGGGSTTGGSAGGSGGSGVVVVSFSASQTVTFNKGTATGATGTDRTSTKTRDVVLALPDSATANSYFTRTGFTVTGWSENADGSSLDYALGANYTANLADTFYPVWTANTYVVTFNKGSASGATGADQTATKTHGVNLVLPNSATANGYFTRSGFSLTGWSVNADGSTTDYALGATYTTEAIDTLYPVWAANTYVVTFNKGSASGATGSDQTATKTGGVSLTLPDSATANGYFTRSGFTVSGWSVNADASTTDYALGATYTTEAVDTLYPVWSARTFTITFNKGSASGAAGSDQTATKTGGVNLALPNSATANGYFTKTGYTVTGWSANADGSTTDYALGANYTTEAIDTLYPVWTPNTYTVTYTYNSATGGNSVTSTSYTVDGIRVSLPSPTRTGFTFDGWYAEAGFSTLVGGAGASYAPTGSATLYAKWSAATFTVIFEYNGATGGNSDDDDEYTTGGQTITLPTPTKPGYTFGGWYSNVTLTNSVGAAGASYSPTANLTIFAKWTAITRTVTYHRTNSGSDTVWSGSVPTDSGSYIIGDSVVIKANSGSITRTGYSFVGWVTSADGTGTALNAGETLTVAEANIDLYPKWSADTYTITYHRNGASGTLARASDSFTTGDPDVTLPGAGTLARTGYTFGGWATTPTGADVGATYSTTSDVTLYAVWTIKSITYSYAKGFDGNNNSLSAFGFTATFPSGQTRTYGTSITLSSSVDREIDVDGVGGVDHQFLGWSDGTSVYAAGSTYILGDTNPTFTAQWIPVYSVRYSLSGGTLSGSDLLTDAQCLGSNDTCTSGQSITLNEAPTRPGFTFLGWEDQSGTLHAAEDTLTVTSTRYLFSAQWQAIQYNIGFNSLGGSNAISNQTKTIGQLVTMPNPGTKTGYTFGGWSDGTLSYGVGTTFTVGAASKSFSAQWIADVYTVSYDWQGGAGSTPKVSDSYTVGTGDMTLPTASGSGYSRDGYNFSGWSTSIGGALVSGFRPTADDVLYAIWADGNYTLSYDPKGGTIGSGLGTVSRGGSVTLPTPVRDNFTFVGWFDAATGGTKLGGGGDSFTPSGSSTLYARWVQDSLYGVDLATLETANTYTASNSSSTDTTLTHIPTGTSARVQIPSGALPNGTVVTVRYFKETSRQSDLIPGDNTYFFALLVSWLSGTGDSATVPDTAVGKPITVTLNNSKIKAGAMVYQVIGESVTELGRATVDGSVTVELTEDPELVVAATTPSAPTSVVGTAGDTRATVSWTAGNSGGSAITGYTVTASPGGATCSTASTSCTISSLSNNTSYTFRVVANNALGTSTASAASSAVTPVGATYSVTFDATGGSSVSNGSFFSGSTVSAPTNPSRSGFTFAGWATTQGDATTRVTFPYAPGVTNAITLYALWTVAPVEQGSRGGGNAGANNQQSSRTLVVPPGRTTVQPQPNVTTRPITAPVVIIPERGFDPDAGSKATVGGQSIPVTKSTPQDGGVSVGVGRVQVEISPTSQQGPAAPSAPGRATDLSVSTGQSATVSGGGLLPGSVLQVWLPGLTGSAAKELARIPVKSDGSFVSELSFTPQQTGTPVPIGRQVLQVTGFDERGDQTVVDMTIMIAQGAPAPEPNRTTGALPGLPPGQSLATTAGVPESVVVEARPSTQEVAVISGEWSFTVGLPETRGSVQESDGGASIIFEQQQTAAVSGEGFQPDTRVDIWLFSDPTLLGSVIVAADGSFSGEVYLDPNFAVVGEHTLQLQGVGMDGFIRAANLGVVVEGIEAPTSEAGSSVLWWVLGLSALVALLIAIAILASRRGRRALH